MKNCIENGWWGDFEEEEPKDVENYLEKVDQKIMSCLSDISIDEVIDKSLEFYPDIKVETKQYYAQSLKELSEKYNKLYRNNQRKSKLALTALLDDLPRDEENFVKLINNSFSENDNRYAELTDEQLRVVNEVELCRVQSVLRSMLKNRQTGDCCGVVIFGSFAKKQQNSRSDIDIFQITENSVLAYPDENQMDVINEEYSRLENNIERELENNGIQRFVSNAGGVGINQIERLVNFIDTEEEYVVVGISNEVEKGIQSLIEEIKSYEKEKLAS